MEVHHHGHVHSKSKWKEYLFQFLMLFLAVFCGFYAEYQLEHKIEKDREKQYIRSLVTDLRSDTAQLTARLNFRMEKMKHLDTMMYLLKSGELPARLGTLYYHGFFAPFAVKFVPANGVLSQLKNAGGLRLLRKTRVVDSLLHIDIQTQWVVDFEIWERERFMDMSPYEKVFDASVFENNLRYEYPEGVFSIHGIKGNPPLLSVDKEDLDGLYNRVQMQKRINAVMINRLYQLKMLVGRLIGLIQEEYRLKT